MLKDIKEEIESCNISEFTPLAAMNFLNQLKEKIKNTRDRIKNEKDNK